MKYSEMTPEEAARKRKYLRDRYLSRRVLKKNGTFKSKYRFKNDGHNNGITAHKVIAETVLGRALPDGAEIHHVDGNGLNNTHSNLVICPSHGYHMLLHLRQRALEACGNANWLKCVFCKKWDAPENLHLYIPADQLSPRANHSECNRLYSARRRREALP